MFNPLSTVHHPDKCVFYGMEDGDHNHLEIGYCAYHFEGEDLRGLILL